MSIVVRKSHYPKLIPYATMPATMYTVQSSAINRKFPKFDLDAVFDLAAGLFCQTQQRVRDAPFDLLARHFEHAGLAKVLRLDGEARLWWKPHHGTEAEHPYDRGPDDTFGGGACEWLQRHVVAHLRAGNAFIDLADAEKARRRDGDTGS